MGKLEDMARRRKEAHAKLLAAKSPVYRAFLEMERAAFSDGALPKKHKELIAVGISVATDCESCMQWQIERASAAGATSQAEGWERVLAKMVAWGAGRDDLRAIAVVGSHARSDHPADEWSFS